MTEVQRITDQLKRAFEGDAWHGPAVRELLADVPAERAAARPIADAHSIWEIVNHILAWHVGVRRRVEGEVVELTGVREWPPVSDASASAWRATLDTLETSYRDLMSAVTRLDDSHLYATVRGGTSTVYFQLHGLIQHDLYHAGQIALLKKAG
jgi:uncharacterized damage-inducible protein DinB